MRKLFVFILLASTAAFGQSAPLGGVGAHLPLVTAGTVLRWAPGGDEVVFDLPETAWVKLSIYSPGIDLDEAGDEVYVTAPLKASFSLSGPSSSGPGGALRSESFSLASSAWLTFYEGRADAGRYTLRSQLVGNGKNVYLLKLETSLPDIELRADSVSVNADSETYQDAFSFDIEGYARCALELYDGDGDSELAARLRLPTGTLQLVVSGDRRAVSQALPRLPGRYTVQLALPAERTQKTNAVRLGVLCDGERQLVTLLPAARIDAPLNVIPLPQPLVTVTPKRPLPLSDVRAALVPARSLELPQVRVNVLGRAKFGFTRTLSAATLSPCQSLTVTLNIVNTGTAAGDYLLREALPEGLRVLTSGDAAVSGHELVWQGNLAAGEQVELVYSADLDTATVSAPATSLLPFRGLLATLSDKQLGSEIEPDAQILVEDTLTRADFLTEVTLADDAPIYSGDVTEIVVSVTNPRAQPVTVALKVQNSGRLEVVTAPQTLDLPAAGRATASLTVRALEDGPGLLEVTPYCAGADMPAGTGGLLQLEVLALPELPAPRTTTTVVVDVAAYDLPLLEGLVLVEVLPDGVGYVTGSAAVNGVPAADPARSGGALVFTLPPVASQVSFTVLHEGPLLLDGASSLLGLTPEPELLLGDAAALALYTRAEPSEADMVARERVGAVILSPAPGLVLRDRNRVTVSADTPLSSDVSLTVGGVPVEASAIGRRVLDPNLNRQTFDYVGVALEPGPNKLRLESSAGADVLSDPLVDIVTVYYAGPAVSFTATPVGGFVADSAKPLALDIVLADAWGNAPQDGFVTLEVEGARPTTADASSERAGYQVRSEAGRARLELEPLPEPGDITLRVLIDETFQAQTLRVESDLRPWLVAGTGSVGAAYQVAGGLDFGVGGSFFARGRVLGDALLTLSARYPFGALGPDDSNPYEAFPVPGSSSVERYDAVSRGGVYARLERGLSYAQYGDFTTPLQGEFLDFGREYTGASAAYEGTFGVRAYAAYNSVTDQRTVDLVSDGTSLRFVPGAPLEPGSLRVEIIKKDALGVTLTEDDGDPVTRRLEPLHDFRINEETGVLELFRPVPLSDAALRPYYLRLSYRLADKAAGRAWQVGAQAETTLYGVTLRAGVAQESGAAVSRVVAGGARYAAAGLSVETEVAYGAGSKGDGGDVSGGVALRTRLLYDAGGLTAEARWRFVSAGYRSPNSAGAGHTVDATLSYAFSQTFGVAARLNLVQTGGNLSTTADALGVYQGRDFDLQFGVNLQGGLLRPLVGGNLYNLFGWQGSRVGVVHRQGITQDARSVTQFSVALPVFEALSVTLTDELVWGNSNALLLGVEARLDHDRLRSSLCRAAETAECPDLPDAFGSSGTTVVTAQYEIPGGVSAAAGRVRLGLDTTVKASESLSFQFGVEYRRSLFDMNKGEDDALNDTAAALRLGATYDTHAADATLRYELAWTPETVKHVVSGGSTFQVSERLFGSVTGTYLYDSRAGSSFTASVAAAYRGVHVSVLSNNMAQLGAFKGDGDTLSGDTRISWAAADRFDVRFGYAYRYVAGSSYLDLVSVGGSFYAWQGGNVLAQGRLFDDWTRSERAFGASLEVSQRLGCGVYGVAGYNLGGLNRDYGPVYGGGGVFVRLDAVFDEQWTCGGRTSEDE